MLWKMNGMTLEDILPVPKKPPGRHFSAGYHMLGKTASSYDMKYAQMTYGDHYRKKIEDEIGRERNRLDEVMMEPRQQALEKNRAMKTAQKATKGYDLNELRHHQRRCAALLFGARQQGSHEVPYLVRWAPRRRESYYLMSERVYNDRLVMKLRQQEEEERRRMLANASPINFDFDDKFGNTRHLYEFQNLINITSRHIKGMNFNSEYEDYDYDFNQQGKTKLEEQQGCVSTSPSKNGEGNEKNGKASKQSRVQFSDVTDHESDTNGDRLRRERRRARRAAREPEDLDMSDIELDLSSRERHRERGDEDSSVDTIDDEDNDLSDLLSKMSLEEGSRRSRRGRHSKGSRKTRKTGSYSSDFYDGSERYSPHGGSSFANKSLLANGEDDELEDGVSELGGAHNSKYCKHLPTNSMKKKAQDYYKKLPRLLRTSELREKAFKLKEKSHYQPTGPFVNHECMATHKTAYERALALVRGRSLPAHYTDLWNRSTSRTFSYFPGMPGTEQTVIKDNKGGYRKLAELSAGPGGLKRILGEVDMNDFYKEDDELIYYIKPDELKTVVPASSNDPDSSSDDDDDDDDDYTSATLKRATSESYTLKMKSSLGTDTELSNS